MKKILSISISLFTGIILIGLLFIAFSGKTNEFTPFKMYSVESGSMEPSIRVGSLIVVRPQTTYQSGDVVTFYDELGQAATTHRIVSITGKTVQTKGDANEEADIESIDVNRIVGKVTLNIPYLGFPVLLSQTRQGSILFIFVPIVAIVILEFISITKELEKMFQNKHKKRKEKELQKQKETSTGLYAYVKE